MTNSAKNKGDRAEREIVAYLSESYPDLVSVRARRVLGAGRKDDEGDVLVFEGVSIQVKNWKAVGTALKAAAAGAVAQRVNAQNAFGVGVVKVPNARGSKPRWLASALSHEWPGGVEKGWPVFRQSSRMLAWLATSEDSSAVQKAREEARTVRERKKVPPLPVCEREKRICLFLEGGQSLVVAPIEAWVQAWQAAR